MPMPPIFKNTTIFIYSSCVTLYCNILIPLHTLEGTVRDQTRITTKERKVTVSILYFCWKFKFFWNK